MLSGARSIYQAEPPRHQFSRRNLFDLKLLRSFATPMRNLTEREIIRVFANQFDHLSQLPLGFNDDVSVVPLTSKTWMVMKMDMLVGSTDVPPGMTTEETARKAVVATVSDFAAKGIKPRALMASVGIPPPAQATKVREIARGLYRAAREYDCQIIGGDTNQAEDLTIDVAGFGIANPTKLVRRNGARQGDIVAVTGTFGRSSAGLKILMSQNKRDLVRYPSLVKAALHPKARLTEGIALAKIGGVTSSIDSSDGLAWSLHELAEASRVGITLNKIPIASRVARFAREHRLSPSELALYGGEEYELVLTIRPARFNQLKKAVPLLQNIGTVVKKAFGVSAQLEQERVKIEHRGWQHFA